jgi:hypothetical protein
MCRTVTRERERDKNMCRTVTRERERQDHVRNGYNNVRPITSLQLRDVLYTDSHCHVPLHRATTTAVQMAAPVAEIMVTHSYNAVQSVESQSTFRANMSPPCSGLKGE